MGLRVSDFGAILSEVYVVSKGGKGKKKEKKLIDKKLKNSPSSVLPISFRRCPVRRDFSWSCVTGISGILSNFTNQMGLRSKVDRNKEIKYS